MNINDNAYRVLCYGDSNTWGYIPGSGERFPKSVRWTGLLQASLRSAYEIIEEGLNSRTTDLDDPKNEGKNGATYLRPCLQTHYPIDLVILMLGTNDLKERFHRAPEQIAEGIERLLKIMRDPDANYNHSPKVILMSPPLVDETVEGVSEKYLGAGEKSKRLGGLYKQVAGKYNMFFIDLSAYVLPSKKDGYHLDVAEHKMISELLKKEILSLIPTK